MAYLTNYTFSKLCLSLKHENAIGLDEFKQFVWEDERIGIILNKLERGYLFSYVQMLQDAEAFFKIWFNEVEIHIDSKKYVFEKTHKLKFHLQRECKFMQRDFVGYIIPAEIQSVRDNGDAVFEYRHWFKENDFVNKINLDDQSALIMRYNAKYLAKYPGIVKPLNENSKLIDHFTNSETAETGKGINKEELIQELTLLIKQHRLNFPCPTTRKISKWHSLIKEPDSLIEQKIIELFSKEFLQGYGLTKVKEKLRVANEINRTIMTKLVDYFKWTYELKDKRFNSVTLESFGLECCHSCRLNADFESAKSQ